MIGFLRKAFVAIAEAERLKAEADAAKEVALGWERRFLAEIAANRRREDALRKELLRQKGIPTRIPERAENEDEWAETVHEPEQPSLLFRSEVEQVAQQLVEQAELAGQSYSAAQYDALCKAIESDPASYGIG